MTGNVGKKALVAGLLGTAFSMSEQKAFSETFTSILPKDPSPTLYFALGCLAGAAATGCISLITYLIYTRKTRTGDVPIQSLPMSSLGSTSLLDTKSEISQSPDTNVRLYVREEHTGSAPQHITHDLVEIAENYVRHETFKERLATRAEGVAKILAERLGAHNFDDLPVIERADGTVGDVGTSWWNARLGETVRRVGDFSSGEYADHSDVPVSVYTNTPADIRERSSELHFGNTQYLSSAPAADTERFVAGEGAQSSIDTLARAKSIAQSVPEVNIGAYPAIRTADELDHKDLWEEALNSMSQKDIASELTRAPLVPPVIHEQTSVVQDAILQVSDVRSDVHAAEVSSKPTDEFIDIVGEADTLDEIDNLADKTAHITSSRTERPAKEDSFAQPSTPLYVEQTSTQPQTYRTPSTTLTLLEGGSQRLFKLDNVARLAHTSAYQIHPASKTLDEVLDEAYDKAYHTHTQALDPKQSQTDTVDAYITAPKHMRARRHQTTSVLPPRHMAYVAKKEA